MISIVVTRRPVNDSKRWRHNFAILNAVMTTHPTEIYLDYAAATPIDQRVLTAMMPYFSERFYNPSSPYEPAVQVRYDYNQAKAAIARTIGAMPDELVMTAGATESINLAFSIASGHVVVPAIEHHAVLSAAHQHDYTEVAVTERGRVTVEAIKAAIRPDTTLVSVALANNELGTLQPIADIARMIASVREARRREGNTTPLYLHSDASQGAGLIDIQTARLGVDLLTLNAAKVYGPKQMGLLWAHRQVAIRPTIVGGGQERGLRSGTENVAGTIGYATAMTQAHDRRKRESVRLRELRDTLQKKLTTAVPDTQILGDQSHRLPNFLTVSWDGIDAERLIFTLERRGVYVATGSACAANSGTRSHVLTAIGLTDSQADGSLRMSLGAQTDQATIDAAAEEIIAAVTAERARSAR